MRMRKKKNRDARMERCQAVWVREPALLRGHWRERFRPGCELRLEIGCGKGAFTVKTAQNEPDVFLVGLERSPDAALIAMERAIEAGLTNVAFVCGDAAYLSDLFAPGEVDRIYLNFSDPCSISLWRSSLPLASPCLRSPTTSTPKGSAAL